MIPRFIWAAAKPRLLVGALAWVDDQCIRYLFLVENGPAESREGSNWSYCHFFRYAVARFHMQPRGVGRLAAPVSEVGICGRIAMMELLPLEY